jgi:mRNA interferase MazF
MVTVALQGDFGKPRPASVIQSDLFDAHSSITILPVTGELRDAPLFRISVNPSGLSGLSKPSQMMVDKPQSIAREKIGAVIGHLDDETMLAVNRALAVFLGFA